MHSHHMHVKIEGHPPNLHRIHNQSEKNDTLHYVRHFKIQMTKISFLSRFINTRLQHLMVNHRGCFHFSEKWHKHITHRISRRNIPTDDLLCVAKPIPQNITEEVRLLTKLIDKFSTKSLSTKSCLLVFIWTTASWQTLGNSLGKFYRILSNKKEV